MSLDEYLVFLEEFFDLCDWVEPEEREPIVLPNPKL